MRYVACLLCVVCARMPVRAGEEHDRYEEQLVVRAAGSRVERAWHAERGERSTWVKEWAAAFPGKGPAAGEDPSGWFSVLAGGGDEWLRTDAVAAGLGSQYDRLLQRLELGPVPSIRRDEFQRFAKQLRNQQPPPPPGGEPSTDNEADKAFRVLDRDGDGELTRDELSTALKDEKGKIDANGDGRISKEEYREYFKKRVEGKVETLLAVYRANDTVMRNFDGRGGRPKGSVPAWFDTLDTDMDGQIGLYEWRKAGRSIAEFNEMDLNGDGLLTREEYMRYVKLNDMKLKEELGPVKGKK